MENANAALMKNEKKELLIFLLVAFGIPFLMGIPLAIMSTAGKDTTVFAIAQMFYPAAGLMLAKLICSKNKSLLPKKFFIAFLLLAAVMILWCFLGFFTASEAVLSGWSYLVMFASIVLAALLFQEDKEKRDAYGLVSKNWKLSVIILILFVLLYVFRNSIIAILSGTQVWGDASPSQVMTSLLYLPVAFLVSFPAFLGEEYGWRCYFQPLLQRKFGLIKGVLLFGALWGLWHLPLDLFYYVQAGYYAPKALAHNFIFRQVICISLGIFMAYAFMKTQNLWLPILIHFINNNLSIFIVGNQEFTWQLIGVWALVSFALFSPFLFSKVFRKQVVE